MLKQFTLNKNKSIGKVIYIVEGEKKEITLLSHIFTKILNYSVVYAKRQKGIYEKYVSAENQDSKVYLINSETSNIGSIKSVSGKEYLDAVFKALYEKYQLDTTNTATYYIFDRDCGSNLATDCRDLIGMLKNSRDNGYESNGLLLLSYPSIESYIFSCFEDSTEKYIDTASALKQKTNAGKYQYNKLEDKEMLLACTNTRAIKEGRRLLDLCKSDNLGVRYDLMHLFALVENKEKAEELFRDYREEQTSQMMLPLCFLYYKIGDTEIAKNFLLKIKGLNKDLPKFIKMVLDESIYDEMADMLGMSYCPNTIEELLSEYDRFYYIFDSCPLFFTWAKTVLSKKNN